VTAVFPDSRRAAAARDRLLAAGVAAGDVVTRDAAIPQYAASAHEGNFMARVVVIIVAWSIVGTAIGAGLGAALSLTIGPSGTSGLIIQMVSWAIFAHMLGGIWAGYLLLADRSGREIGHGRPVILTARCGTIDETFLTEQLRQLGAISVEAGERTPAPQR
jgi:hypothetical protein